ncbi:MAG: hypothetical protein CMI15_05800 [Opitutaceae bacterium]|nr:hypothetical protein [Opitutaceae bacterium]
MLRFIPLLCFSVAASIASGFAGEPPLDVEYIDGEHVYIKNPHWHEKEEGQWLFTFRLEASAERLVRPVAHLHLYHKEETEEEERIVWEETGIVWRRKFDRSYGSRKASFVRIFIDSLP